MLLLPHDDKKNIQTFVTYNKPQIWMTGRQYEEPVEYYVEKFNGHTLFGARKMFWDRDISEDIGIERFYRTAKPASDTNSVVLNLFSENFDAPKLEEQLTITGPELRVWNTLPRPGLLCDWDLGLNGKKQQCIFCAGLMQSATTGKVTDQKRYFLLESIYICPDCGWWRTEGTLTHRYDWHKEHVIRADDLNFVTYGAVRQYNISAAELPISDLRIWLQAHPHHVAHSNPKVFEQLMADCFKDKYGNVDVIHVGKSGDHGIDLKLIRGDTIETIVQIKRRQDLNKTEKIQIVRELNGVLLKQGIAHGIIVTTAKKFSKGAKEEATSTSNSLARYHVDLLVFNDVVELLNCRSREVLIHERVSDHLKSFSSRQAVLNEFISPEHALTWTDNTWKENAPDERGINENT